MSVPTTGVADPTAHPRPRRRITWWHIVAVLLAVLLALSVLELVTGADDLTSRGTVAATLIATVPIMLAGTRRPVVRARGHRQHRPRGDDDPRHLGSRVLRLPLRRLGRCRWARC